MKDLDCNVHNNHFLVGWQLSMFRSVYTGKPEQYPDSYRRQILLLFHSNTQERVRFSGTFQNQHQLYLPIRPGWQPSFASVYYAEFLSRDRFDSVGDSGGQHCQMSH